MKILKWVPLTAVDRKRMKQNLQLFEGNPQYYYCILHSQYIVPGQFFFLYLLAEKSITKYLAVL